VKGRNAANKSSQLQRLLRRALVAPPPVEAAARPSEEAAAAAVLRSGEDARGGKPAVQLGGNGEPWAWSRMDLLEHNGFSLACCQTARAAFT